MHRHIRKAARTRASLFAGATLLLLAPCSSPACPADGGQSSSETESLTAVLTPFAANLGQAEPHVRFYAHRADGIVFVSDTAALLLRTGESQENDWRLTETLKGGATNPVTAGRPMDTVLHYFRGNDSSHWVTNVSTYESVNFGEVYDGIEMALAVGDGRLIRRFVLAPGADPGRIRVHSTGDTPAAFLPPCATAYQICSDGRAPVEAACVVNGADYGFTVGPYDARLPLVIESALGVVNRTGTSPAPLSTARSGGRTYTLGQVPSPVGAASDRGAPGDGIADLDIWVAETDAGRIFPREVAFIGGSHDETAESSSSVTVGANGDVFIAGRTESEDFPTTPGAFDECYNFWGDVFVTRLRADLSGIVASTYLGEWGSESCGGLAVDREANVYVAGATQSSSFPTTQDGYDPTFNGERDVFLCRLDDRLTSLVASTFLGGDGDDVCREIEVDACGVCVAGTTDSADFPSGPETRFGTCRVPVHAFFSRLDGNLRSILIPGPIGGSGTAGASP